MAELSAAHSVAPQVNKTLEILQTTDALETVANWWNKTERRNQ